MNAWTYKPMLDYDKEKVIGGEPGRSWRRASICREK